MKYDIIRKAAAFLLCLFISGCIFSTAMAAPAPANVIPSYSTQTKPDVSSITIVLAENEKKIPISVSIKLHTLLRVKTMLTPAGITDDGITWSSSNGFVASYNHGSIVGTGTGKATITATASNGKKASFTVNVTSNGDGEQKYKVIISSSVTLERGTSRRLNVRDQVQWTSSDESVATVDANGRVTAVGPGTATIYAEKNGELKASFEITVQDKKEVSEGSQSSGEIAVVDERRSDRTQGTSSGEDKPESTVSAPSEEQVQESPPDEPDESSAVPEEHQAQQESSRQQPPQVSTASREGSAARSGQSTARGTQSAPSARSSETGRVSGADKSTQSSNDGDAPRTSTEAQTSGVSSPGVSRQEGTAATAGNTSPAAEDNTLTHSSRAPSSEEAEVSAGEGETSPEQSLQVSRSQLITPEGSSAEAVGNVSLTAAGAAKEKAGDRGSGIPAFVPAAVVGAVGAACIAFLMIRRKKTISTDIQPENKGGSNNENE